MRKLLIVLISYVSIATMFAASAVAQAPGDEAGPASEAKSSNSTKSSKSSKGKVSAKRTPRESESSVSAVRSEQEPVGPSAETEAKKSKKKATAPKSTETVSTESEPTEVETVESQSANSEGADDGTTAEQPVDEDQSEAATSEEPTESVAQAPNPVETKRQLASKPVVKAPAKKRVRRVVPEKDFDDYVAEAKDWIVTKGSHVVLVIVLALLALKSTNLFSQKLLVLFTRNKEGTELKKRADTLTSVVRYLMIGTIIAIAGMIILREVGLDIAPLIAGAGVVGLAVGFGAQNVVKDVLSGFFILLEDQVRVGDVVQIADKSGVVEKVTLRMVILRDISYNVHYIPSGEITVVTNMTKEYSGYLYDVGVAYREDVDQVIEVMKEIDEELRNDPEYGEDILEPLEVFGLNNFADSSVIVRARTKTKPIKQWGVGREFNRRLKKRFDELNIEIPFPHMTIYPGSDKQGKCPPLPLNINAGGWNGQDGHQGSALMPYGSTAGESSRPMKV